jgi:hypothetical protein
VVFVVLAEMSTNEPGRRIAAAVGMARPADPTKYGYLSEHHAFGQTEQEAADYAEDLAATMLATTLGIPLTRSGTTTSAKTVRDGRRDRGFHQHRDGSDSRTGRGLDDGRRCGGADLMGRGPVWGDPG